MSYLKRTIFIASWGYISYFFSERMFWSFFRPAPEDSFLEFIGTWIVYSILSYATISLIEYFRINDWKSVFLVGAVYGWLCEGVIVTTMYGTTMGMWATISTTGLSWHALFTILFGWFFITRALCRKVPIGRFVLINILIGLCWAFWALNWGYEGKGWNIRPVEFLCHAWIYSLPLPLAYWAVSRLSVDKSTVSKREWFVLSLFFSSLYIYWNFTLNIFPRSLLLLPLLGLTIAALNKYAIRNTKSTDEKSFINNNVAAFSWRRSLLLLLIPLTATLTYPVLFYTFDAQHTNWLVFIITMPLGYILYLYCIAMQISEVRAELKE